MRNAFNPKKLIQEINNPNRNLQDRLYELLISIGLIGLLISDIIGIFIGENIINIVIVSIIFLVLFGIAFLSIRFQKQQIGAVLIAFILVFLVLPVNFITTGGIYGGAPIWLLFGTVYICLVIRSKVKYFFLSSIFVISIICYGVAFFYQDWIVQHTTEMAYVDSFGTLMIVSALVSGMILFQNHMFRSENEVIQKQKKKIEELNRMQNHFFSSMSHEIRTPINTIIGLNEMILRENVSEEVASDAKNIQSASKMLLSLINDILDMSKIESGKMDIVPVVYHTGDMLSDLVNMIWIRAREKNLEFHIDVDKKLPSKLYGDEVRIKQILINILNNSVKYTQSGSITLSIHCEKNEKGKVSVIYSVADTGMGIKKESIPYLFKPFKRVDEEKNHFIEGTGLGLAIVKQLVDLMGGKIEVNSVYTKGSTFVVTIPQDSVSDSEIGELNLESRHKINDRKHYKQSFEAPNASVLIVDDNESNLMVAEKLLRETKVKIDTATSGRKCLEKTLQNHYDVILMDHLMPEMDGIECLHELRKQTGGFNHSVPVIVLTANAGGENQALYQREGFDGYLLKPVTGNQLETELLRHLPRELVTVMKENTVGELETPVYVHKEKVPILISTDSVCDLPKSFTEKYRISVMPYRVVTEGGEFLDEIETETEGLLTYMIEGDKEAKSEPPTAADYEKYFAELLTRAQYVFHISMAKKVSLGYANALEASRIFDNVSVFNSGHLSSGMGLMVLRASECVIRGMNTEQIEKEMEKLKTRVKTSFIMDKTEFLARSGRLPEKIEKLCSALMLHPVLVLKKSTMKVGAVCVGTRAYSWKKYVETTLGHPNHIEKKILFICYVGISDEELDKIVTLVKQKVDFEQIVFQRASSAIATNCGPGTFGLLYIAKE